VSVAAPVPIHTCNDWIKLSCDATTGKTWCMARSLRLPLYCIELQRNICRVVSNIRWTCGSVRRRVTRYVRQCRDRLFSSEFGPDIGSGVRMPARIGQSAERKCTTWLANSPGCWNRNPWPVSL
jgi:hypothetical protein